MAVTQKILADEITVAEMLADESHTKDKEKKEDEQKTDVLLMEKANASKILEVLNSLFNFALITCNEEMQHIRTFKTTEIAPTQIAQQPYC